MAKNNTKKAATAKTTAKTTRSGSVKQIGVKVHYGRAKKPPPSTNTGPKSTAGHARKQGKKS